MALDTVSVYLPGWLNMHVTSEQHVPELQRQGMFLLSPRFICVSLATNLVRATKLPRWLNWETLRRRHRLSLACLATLGDMPNTVSRTTCLLV